MIALLLMAQAAASASTPVGTYSCSLLEPVSVERVDGVVKVLPVRVGTPGNWTFELTLSRKDAKVNWPTTPMNMNGRWALMQTGSYAGAFYATQKGPCTFAETQCATLVSFAERPDKSLAIVVQPVALNVTPVEKRFEPFTVMIEGSCTPVEAGKSE